MDAQDNAFKNLTSGFTSSYQRSLTYICVWTCSPCFAFPTCWVTFYVLDLWYRRLSEKHARCKPDNITERNLKRTDMWFVFLCWRFVYQQPDIGQSVKKAALHRLMLSDARRRCCCCFATVATNLCEENAVFSRQLLPRQLDWQSRTFTSQWGWHLLCVCVFSPLNAPHLLWLLCHTVQAAL